MNEFTKKEKMERFVTSIHTHVRSIFDAHIDATALCLKIKEMGGKGCVITDHGVLSSIEDYKAVFNAQGLKLIPGVEVYVDGGILGRLHLILIAANDNGYKSICKIVTESNRNLQGGFPVVTKEILERYISKGDVIATSACMQGVISAIYLLNDKVEEKIEKILSKQKKFFSPADGRMITVEEQLKDAEENLERAISERDELKATAEQKFTAREKAVAKSGSEADKKKLEADKIAAKKAQEKLPQAKVVVETAKKTLSQAKKDLKEANEIVAKYLVHEEEILALKKELKSDEELNALAEAEMNWYIDLFGLENFYAEVQYHGIEAEAVCFPKVVSMAKKLGVSLVASNDVHILENTEDERLRRNILRSLRYGEQFEEEQIGDDELYLKDNYQLADALLKILSEDDVIEAINNIEVVFNRCNVEFVTGKHYPKFSDDSEKIFDEAIREGIVWRFPEGMDREHELRLAREVEVIKTMGYVDYHLVVKDFLEYGRLLGFVPKDRLDEVPLTIEELKDFIKVNGWKNGGMLTGPGRGSAAGSLVCYLLGITALDPIKYGLLFERFLNPERISMPDIDSDLANTTRGKVIEYVQNKYGENAVCGIMTTNAQAPRGAINIAAKFYGLKYYNNPMTSLGRAIAKEVTNEVGVSFASKVSSNGKLDESGATLVEYLNDKYSDNRDALEIVKWAQVIEGLFTAYGAHAAGLCIAPEPVENILPLRYNAKLGMMTTQCDMVQVEDNGILKFDFLGLKTLDIITEALRMIEKNYGVIIDPLKIDLEDEAVFDLMSKGQTNSVFQFESNGMKSMLKRFKPTCFEDLIILVSMFRPGPLQYLDGVIAVKNGKKPMEFLCPELEPIIGKTYGAIVYQEQVMEICRALAGFSYGHADQVRRFMSKKKADKLAHERETFVEGCSKNKISSEVANQLFDQMEDFAKYAFNKSHAAAYAYNAYITAWLKCHYPAEFFASALNWTDKDGLSGLMYEAKTLGVTVLAPDVNLSEREFSTDGEVIRFGLSSVAGVKDNAIAIIREREKDGSYESLLDFLRRSDANSKVVTNLISAGAFDTFSDNREALKMMAENIKEILPKFNKKSSFVKSAELVLPTVETLSVEDIVKMQQEAGLKVEITEKTTVDKLQKRIETAKTSMKAFSEELSLIREPKVSEDRTKRLNEEKELLGIYVTQHPIDFYPKAEDLNTTVVSEIVESSTVLYGVVENLDVKARKSDGAQMAFFDVSDRSGKMSACCFTKAYAKFKGLVEEGAVLLLKGKVIVEEGDEDEDDVLKFVVEEVVNVEPKKTTLFMSVSSYAAFHLDVEDYFIKEYSQKDGHELLIFDRALDEVRTFPVKVSEKVLLLQGVKEVI